MLFNILVILGIVYLGMELLAVLISAIMILWYSKH